MILRLALLLLGFALLPTVAISSAWGQGEAPHKRRVPPGYVRVAHGEWDWASRAGHYSPPRWLIDQVDEDLREIQQGLGLRTRGRPVVIYCHDRGEFSRAVTELGGKSPAGWVVALAFPARAIMVIDGSRNPLGMAETITHELVHVVLGMVGDVPRWYHEGLAQWLSGEQPDPKAVTTVNGFAFNEQIASFRDLERFFPKTHQQNNIVYTQSLLFVAYMESRFGAPVHGALVRGLASESFDVAFERATGESFADVESAWHDKLRREFSWWRWFWYNVGLFPVLGLIVIYGFFVQRRLRRRKLARMAEEEAILDAREAALRRAYRERESSREGTEHPGEDRTR